MLLAICIEKCNLDLYPWYNRTSNFRSRVRRTRSSRSSIQVSSIRFKKFGQLWLHSRA
jgi:hypothetical protein